MPGEIRGKIEEVCNCAHVLCTPQLSTNCSSISAGVYLDSRARGVEFASNCTACYHMGLLFQKVSPLRYLASYI